MSNEKFVVTGLSEKEYVGMVINGETKGKCYVCKRSEGDNGVVISEGEKVLTGQVEIISLSVQISDEQTHFYPICRECLILLTFISEAASENDLSSSASSSFSNN
jgi:hypothetical protein